MLTAINTILEMAATLICVNYLFGKRYYFSIYDAVFMVVEVTLIESANYFGLSKGMALFGYVGIYIYELLKFKCSIRKANVNLVLFIIIGVFSQVVCSIPAFILEGYLSIDLLVISVNVFMIILMLILGKKGLLYKISNIILNYDRWIYVATILCLVGAVYLLVIYKMEEYLRVTDYIIFGIWTLLIAVLIVRWQQEKYEKLSKEREYEIHKTYDGVYTQLLDSMRKKQHDFHNHITAIYSHHLMAKDYDTLVALQKKYCDEIMEENRYARLLSHNFCCKQLKRLQHNYPKTSDDILVWRNDVHDKRVDGNDVKSLTFGFSYLNTVWNRTVRRDNWCKQIIDEYT